MSEENVDNEQVAKDLNENQNPNTAEFNESEVSNETDNADGNNDTTAEKVLTEADQIVVLNDKYLRLYSEFDNYRKRTNKEKLDLISTASAGVLKDMLSVMDDFERAMANNVNVDDSLALKEGFQLIYNKFKSILEAKGLKQMVVKGELFDADIHEAIANIPAPSEELKNKVIDDVEKGYYLNDKLIRFAKVVVGN
jgi:molecular chaperone GrpE